MSKHHLFVVIACALVSFAAVQHLSAATITHTFTEGGVRPIVGGTYTGAEDASIFGSFANENVGQRNNLPIGGGSNLSRILMRFNELDLLSGLTVDAARLELTLEGTTTTAKTINLFQVNPSNWVEGIAEGVSGSTSANDRGVTWNRIDQTNHSPLTGPTWTTSGLGAGTDRGTTILGTLNFTANTAVGTVYTVELNAAGVNLVQNWIDGITPNAGFFLQAQSESGNPINFYSAQSALVADHPRLMIDTLVPPVPEPASFVSLAAGLCVVLTGRKRRVKAGARPDLA